MAFCVGVILFLIYCVAFSLEAGGEYHSGGFLPSGNNYNQRNLDQLAEPSTRVDKSHSVENNDLPGDGNKSERTQRFGISSYGNTGQTYPTASGTNLYGPLKIDLGGVLLGSIIGLGAIVILPKLLQAFSYSYGGNYARSVETGQSDIGALLGQLDGVLARYDLDTSVCAARVACAYTQSARERVSAGDAAEADILVDTLASNSLVHKMLDGTSVYDAIMAGRSHDTNCQEKYPKCHLDKNTVVKMLSNVLPS